jgi:hypothetical protein
MFAQPFPGTASFTILAFRHATTDHCFDDERTGTSEMLVFVASVLSPSQG